MPKAFQDETLACEKLDALRKLLRCACMAGADPMNWGISVSLPPLHYLLACDFWSCTHRIVRFRMNCKYGDPSGSNEEIF